SNYQGSSYVVPQSYTPPGGSTPVAAARGGNAIDEDSITCVSESNGLCQFPYSVYPIPGIVSWKAGVTLAKDKFLQHGRKDSYRYVLVGHALGLPASNWSLADNSLTSISVSPQQVATVTTAAPHNLTAGSHVTISG